MTIVRFWDDFPVAGCVQLIVRDTVDYTDDDHALQGWLVHNRGCRRPTPGVLVFHEYMGLGDYLARPLEKLARRGYVVMAADMYGKGIRPENGAVALRFSRPLRADRKTMRCRALAALNCLQQCDGVDSQRIAAVGYSFGGCAALELARSGASIRAAVSFYGYLDTPLPAAQDAIRARLLVLHGLHDPVVPLQSLAAFHEEMAAARADSRVITYADAGHGFCNPLMHGSQDPWNRYSRRHDERSWKTLAAFLEETLTR